MRALSGVLRLAAVVFFVVAGMGWDARALAVPPQALRDLEVAAAKAMQVPLQSVTEKTRAAASGDLHDYSSMGPYWWPNPAKSDGLPYIRRDGEVNPETRADRCDQPRMKRMVDAVEPLAASWALTRNESHARRAGELLRAWFLDPKTKMNPHLEYSQAIPGICEGRGVGLIDGISLLPIPEAVKRLHGAPGWSHEDELAMKAWFSVYLEWILSSRHGKEVDAAANNHGTWHDVQVVVIGQFLGCDEVVRKTLATVAERRLATQIEPDGRQPHETARTKSWHYSMMNLRGMMMLARCAESGGPDLWHQETADGRGIRKALLYLVEHSGGSNPWPHPSLVKPKPDDLLPLVAEAMRIYPPDTFPADLLRQAEEFQAKSWK